MYGKTAGKNTEGLSIASLAPGIYKGYSLKEVKAEKTTKADGTTGKNILTFFFDGPQGAHQHTEYEVEATDAKFQSKAENLSKRVTHVMTKFVPREVADNIGGENFEEYAKNVAAALNANVLAPVKDLELKVLGSVYEGKASSACPGYPPFLARASATDYKSLNFSANEAKANAAYAAHTSASPDNDSTPTTTSQSSTVDTDF